MSPLRPRRPTLVLGVPALAILALLGVLELGGQVYGWVRPGYQVLFLTPDRDLGWRHLPDLYWTWTGRHWYAREFSVAVKSNSRGFRDAEHREKKTPGRTRVAVLGDSFVEAVQVPLEKTATQVLERETGAEALNFGVSNYGVGQYLLVWRHVASRFSPDVVFAFVAGPPLARSLGRSEPAAFSSAGPLEVRPTFATRTGEPELIPARDYDRFVAAQAEVVRDQFGGRRSRRKPHGFFLADVFEMARTRAHHWLDPFFKGPRAPASGDDGWLEVPDRVVDANLVILRRLHRETAEAGARLVLADASRFLSGSAVLGERLKAFAAREGIGYLPLSDALAAAERGGTPVRWAFDAHFNEEGNRVFAAMMAGWLRDTLNQ